MDADRFWLGAFGFHHSADFAVFGRSGGHEMDANHVVRHFHALDVRWLDGDAERGLRRKKLLYDF